MPGIKEARLNALIDQYGNKALLRAKVADFIYREGETENDVTFDRQTLEDLLRFYELISLAVLTGYISPGLNHELTIQLFDLQYESYIEEQYIKDGKNDLVNLLIKLNMSGRELDTGYADHVLLFDDFLILKGQWEKESDAVANFVNYYLSNEDQPVQREKIEAFAVDLYLGKVFKESYWQQEDDFQPTIESFLIIQDLLNGLADILLRAESELLQSALHAYFSAGIQTLSNLSEIIKIYFEVCLYIPLFYPHSEQASQDTAAIKDWQWQSTQSLLQSLNHFHFVTNFKQFDALRNLLQSIEKNDVGSQETDLLAVSIRNLSQRNRIDTPGSNYWRNDLERGMEGFVEV